MPENAIATAPTSTAITGRSPRPRSTRVRLAVGGCLEPCCDRPAQRVRLEHAQLAASGRRPCRRDDGDDLEAAATAEDLRGVGDAHEPGSRHLEHAELVRGAEAVLGRTQDAMRVVAVALELEDAVDEVLEHARACDGAVLGDVA